MPTLQTNQTRLAEINRQRDLAQALQQSAMSFAPIQHPMQGVAKLAQAIAATKIGGRADEREKMIADERRNALMRALQQGSPQQMLSGLSATNPELVEGVVGNLIQRQLMVEGGMTDTQLSQLGKGNYERVGQRIQRSTNSPVEIVKEKGGLERMGTIDATGQFTPVSGKDLMPPLQQRQDVPFVSEQKAWREFEGNTNGVFFAIDEMRRVMDEGDVAGGVFDKAVLTIDSVVEQVARLGRALGGEGGKELAEVGRYRNIQGFDPTRARLSDGTVVDVSEAYNYMNQTGMVGAAAQLQAIGIGLSYAMARQEDEGGRLSEADVLWQMQRIGLTSGSDQQIKSGLFALERQFANNYLFRAGSLGPGMNANPSLMQRAQQGMGQLAPNRQQIGGNAAVSAPPGLSSEGSYRTNQPDGYYTDENGLPVKVVNGVAYPVVNQ
jgi:hypothetical protein